MAPAPPSETSILATIESFGGYRDRDLPRKILAWLCHRLRDARYARLDQAGHHDSRLALAHVFVDLEAEPDPRSMPARARRRDEGSPTIVAEMLGARPGLHLSRSPVPEADPQKESEHHNGFLLIGGPGQGKSTVAQYLCQVHRTAVLDAVRDRLEQDHRDIVVEVQQHVQDDHLPQPAELCLPASLSLPELAAWMVHRSVEPGQAVASFLCEQIRKALPGEQAGIPVDDLETLLGQVPWLVVFDGLDEVPASGGKEQVIEAIESFIHAMRERDARSVLVATTRPQGYHGELSAALVPRYLSPLSQEQALNYGRRLVRFRYHGEADRQQKILDRMEQACQEPATAKLMTTPLQVTIMAALVDRIGRPPHQRWRLFRDYYQVVYERELERPHSPAATLLRDYRAQIEEIHQYVALILQVESESRGGTDALLDREELERLIEGRLAEEEFSLQRRKDLALEIRAVATERLVFLVSPQEDHYGFELRSLQEFMAAEALTNGRDEDVAQRLQVISRSSFWRNVFLFAAGKCFADRRHQRDTIIEICRKLDEEDERGRAVMAGAYLALDLLEDGSVDAPKYITQLGERAARLVDLPVGEEHDRLAHLEGAARDALEDPLRRGWPGPVATQTGRWSVLTDLIGMSVPWAASIAEEFWPSDAESQRLLIEHIPWFATGSTAWLAARVAAQPEHFPPQVFERHLFGVEGLDSGLLWIPLRWGQYKRASFDIGIRTKTWRPLGIEERLRAIPVERLSAAPAWRPWYVALRFEEQATAASLAATLEELAATYDEETLRWWSRRVPWVLGGFLAIAESPEQLIEMAAEIRNGHRGDRVDWEAMERSWQEEGVTLDRLLKTADTWPFLVHVYLGSRSRSVHPGALPELLDRYLLESRPHVLQLLAWLIKQQFSYPIHLSDDASMRLLYERLGPTQVQALAETGMAWNPLDAMIIALEHVLPDARLPWLQAAEHLVLDHTDISGSLADGVTRGTMDYMVSQYESDHRPGLLCLLGRLLVLGVLVEMHLSLPEVARPFAPSKRFDYELARWAQGDAPSEEIEAWLRELAAAPEQRSTPEQRRWLRRRIATTGEPPDQRLRYLDILARMTPQDASDEIRELHAQRLALWSSQRSGLDQTSTWYQLGLSAPAPRDVPERGHVAPAHASVAAPAYESGSSPVVQRVEIRGIRVFQALDLSLTVAPRQQTARWLVFLGENGVGKSTLLRSLAIALAEPEIAQSLIANARAPLLRSDTSEGDISVTVDGVTFSSRILREGDRERVAGDRNGAPRPMVFAYGCSRGSAVGGPDREVSYAPVDRVITLFDETQALISAETWMKLLCLNALTHKGHHAQIFESTMETLRRLLPGVERIDVDGNGVWFSGPSVGDRTPLAGLSDGYITTLGWVTDMLARWLHRAEKLDKPVGPGFNERMRGLVLVDEVDLHLHPRWQREVISTVRRAFPLMSFVVTTHNPLTLLGADDGEIVVLRRDHASDAITATQMDLPRGIRTDQVLTGEWFGLASTLDPETIGLLEKHRRLLRDPVPPSSPERQYVEAELKRRLDGFPGTTIEQLTRQVAADVLDETYPERTVEEKIVLRAKLKDLVNRRLEQQRKS